MKRSNIGIKDIATFENAEDAYRKARKCKRYREEVLRFTDNLEEELYDLVADLEAGTYRQGEARRFVVYEPKKRDIYALPFRDRVAQHMINNKIEPIVERRFYYHSYACRTDKGMHKAADYAQECIRNLSFEGKQVYILKADIHKYFNSVDHEVLKQIRKIRKRSPKHIRATIKAYRSGKVTKEKLLMKYASWEGHAKHADTYRLRMKIKGQIEAEIKKKELIGNGSITPDN